MKMSEVYECIWPAGARYPEFDGEPGRYVRVEDVEDVVNSINELCSW